MTHIHLPRLCLPDVTLTQGASLEIAKEHIHYLSNALRKSEGDKLRIFNGRDGEWLARIRSLTRKKGMLEPIKRLRPQEDGAGYTLIFSPLKKDATESLLRMACEMGTRMFFPVLMGRTNLRNFNPDRLNDILIEACEQSEHNGLPTLHEPQPLGAFLKSRKNGQEDLGRIAVALERSENNVPRRDSPFTGVRALLIGPEGGFTSEERDIFEGDPNFVPLSLGEGILRAPTAGVAGLATLRALNAS